MSTTEIKILKVESVTKMLSRRFGGKWKYRRGYGWEADDGIRYVHRVLTGRDIDGEYTGESTLCLYYRDNRTPEWV